MLLIYPEWILGNGGRNTVNEGRKGQTDCKVKAILLPARRTIQGDPV